MDNKVQNLVLKILMVVIIGVGALMTYWVTNDDNPFSMKPEEHMEWGKQAYNEKFSGDKKLTMGEANEWIVKETDKIVKEKKETLNNDVSNVIGFTSFLLIFAVVLVLASFIYLITIDYVKALRILAGVLMLGLFMVICYYMASDQVPVCIAAMEGELEPCQEPLYTSANWKIASAAILTTVVLIIITVLAWISGPIMKLFR
jgi:uncharacterized membrane protein